MVLWVATFSYRLISFFLPWIYFYNWLIYEILFTISVFSSQKSLSLEDTKSQQGNKDASSCLPTGLVMYLSLLILSLNNSKSHEAAWFQKNSPSSGRGQQIFRDLLYVIKCFLLNWIQLAWMKTSSQGLGVWPGHYKQCEAESRLPNVGVLAYVAPEVWGKGHVCLKESWGFWKRLQVSFTNFITSTLWCQYQLMPRKHAESTGCQEGAHGDSRPQLGLLPRGRHPQWWIEPAGGVPRESEATGQPLVTALQRSKGAKVNGIITPNWHSWGISSLENLCSVLVVTPRWEQSFVDDTLKKEVAIIENKKSPSPNWLIALSSILTASV